MWQRGQTALHWALSGSQPAVVALLLERGADPNAPDTTPEQRSASRAERMSSAQRLILPGLGRRPLWYVRDWLLLEQLLRHPNTDHTLTDAVRTPKHPQNNRHRCPLLLLV